MIELDRVTKRYPGGHEGLSDVSLRIDAGEMVFLTGHSGAGKSTLLKLISLLERPTRGQIRVNNRNLGHLPRRLIPLHRREIGVIFQDHRLLNDRTVFDNVALPLVVAGANHRDIAKRVRAALDKVGLLHKEKALPVTLSGGEQQRVGIARAVVNRPPVVLADEPTGNLDLENAHQVIELLVGQCRQRGAGLLLITHSSELSARMDRTLSITAGRLLPINPGVATPRSASA
jgi:cell division transport system ATP-binding protein